MIAAIHQPQYLPWLGYFDKMINSDVFCYLDNVQYKKNEWQNRNRIKTANDWQWLTVPVLYRFPQKINEVKVNNPSKWQRKHLQAIITNYKKAPYFNDYFPFFEQTLERSWECIAELNIHLTEGFKAFLGLENKKTVIASDLNLRADPTDRLIDICRAVGADTYLAGQDGAKYMELDRFKANEIEVIFQDYTHPGYPQLFGEFQSHMSIIDLLFNCGEKSREILSG